MKFVWIKLIGVAFSGWSYIYCTTSDCIDNAWEKNNTDFKPKPSNFFKVYILKKENIIYSL